jgi:predicted phage terminase large subunit-like protein
MIRGLLDVWNKSIRPTLTDYRGQAWFLSTPKGHDDYRKLWDLAGQRPQSWARFHAPTNANPHIARDELAQARADLPELVFRQEYGAEFVDFGGAAVRREWLSYGEPPTLTDYRIGMGVDLAIGQTEQAHYTAVVVVAVSPEGRVFIVDAKRDRLHFNAILRLVVAMASKWQPHCIQVEAVQFQASVVQELLRTTALPVVAAHTGSKDKLIRFIPMQKRFEEGLVTLSRYLVPEYEAELLTFPGGDDDDLIDATVYAFRAAASGAIGQVAVAGRLESSRMA